MFMAILRSLRIKEVSSMNYRKMTSIAMIILCIAFCAFVLLYERRARNEAQSRIDEHARIIADALWNYNSQGSSEYLTLACRSHNYEDLVVTDTDGEVFQTAVGKDPGKFERLLMSLNLIPRISLGSDVVYGGKRIGRIEAIWDSRTIHVYAYVLFALLMILAVFHLYVRILHSKHVLEERVRERTSELANSNASLQEEIVERQRVEKALRESEEKYRQIFENEDDAITIADLETMEFLDVNPAAEKLYGYTTDEFLAIRIADLSAEEEKTVDVVKQLAERRAVRVPLRYHKRKDGSIVTVELTCSSYLWQDRKVICAITRDITDRIRAAQEKEKIQAQLQRVEKMESLGLMAGGVAHDLNNILSGIVSYPDLLLMDLPENSPLRRPIEAIRESGQRAADVVADLLTIARGVATGKEVLNLNATAEEYLKSAEHEKLEKMYSSVTFKTELDPDLLNMRGSPTHIKKSLMNLVTNASEAIDGTGTVTISTRNRYLDEPLKAYEDVKMGEYAVLSVADDGSGISPQDLKRIFEPFYTKKVMGRSGTGLGLTVVWNTVQDHDGYVNVKSSEEGTAVELYFPVTREEIVTAGEEVPIEDYLGHGEKILVVDDEERQREIACGLLTKLGYSAEAVSSGEKAIEYVKKHPVDLIVLDMIMPKGINGRETYAEIIKIHPGQKAIIASGFAETDDVKEAQKLGAGKYIKKPFTLEKIGLAIKEELVE